MPWGFSEFPGGAVLQDDTEAGHASFMHANCHHGRWLAWRPAHRLSLARIRTPAARETDGAESELSTVVGKGARSGSSVIGVRPGSSGNHSTQDTYFSF